MKNIDRELMSLLEDCIYQEGLLQKFKDKKAAKKREKILQDRRNMKQKILGAPNMINNEFNRLTNFLLEIVNDGDTIGDVDEGVGELLDDIVSIVHAPLLCANLMTNEELQAAKKAKQVYIKGHTKFIQLVRSIMAKSNDPREKQHLNGVLQNLNFYKFENASKMRNITPEVDHIKYVIEEYNKVMAEKQEGESE